MNKLNIFFKVLTIIGFILIAVFSLFFNPARIPIQSDFNYTHAAAYLILTILGLVAIQHKFSFKWNFFPVFVAAYGYLMEVLQPFFGRHYSLFDAASNAIGVCIAAIIMSIIFWRLHKHIHNLIPIQYGLLAIIVDQDGKEIPHPDWVAGGCVVRDEKFMCKICKKFFTNEQAAKELGKQRMQLQPKHL